MNDMELMWELGQETPLPALSELGLARGRLAAAIAAESTAARAADGRPGLRRPGGGRGRRGGWYSPPRLRPWSPRPWRSH